jgi:hypothetical protein
MVLKNTDNGIIQNWQKGEPCRGADIAFVFLFQQEQRKSSRNGATEHQCRHSLGLPRVGTATIPRVTTLRSGKGTKQLAIRKTFTTPPASHQVKACKKNSLLEFITSLKVRNATTAINAENSSSHRLFGSMVLASQ